MPHRVLVVDDEEAIRTLLKDFLEGRGYLVSCASDGEEGIRLFKSDAPGLVLIDFLLPRKNGFAVADAIRRDSERSNTPIIMMSGVFKNPKTAVEAREKYKVLEFLSKPLDNERLLALITQHITDAPPEEAPRTAKEDASGAASSDAPPPRGLSYYGRSSTPAATKPPAGPAVNGRESASAPAAESSGSELFTGRPLPVIGDEGEIESIPVAMLLSALRYDGLTGMLDLTDHGTHRRLYITHGLPSFMQSNAEGENVGALLLRRGRITEPDFQRCLTYMKSKSRTLQQALLDLRLASEQDLATAYKLLAGQLLPLALGMSSGRFKWRETDAFVGRVPEGNFEPVQVIFEGIKRHVHPPQILKFFKGREDVPLLRTPEFEKLMPFFRRAFSANNVLGDVTGKATYRELIRKHTNQQATVVPQLFAIVTSGMCVLPAVTDEDLVAAAVNTAAEEVSLLGEHENSPSLVLDGESEDDEGLTGEEKRAKSAVLRFYDEIMSKNFFQIFGADPNTEIDRIKAAYFDLAKKWHVDTYSGLRLGGARTKLEAIFQRITEAYDTITDKSKREEYIIYVERESKGLSNDVNAILRAEQLFDQAAVLIRRRDYGGARGVLEEAVSLSPGDALYLAELGWVVFNQDPKGAQNLGDAVAHLRAAVQQNENCAIAYQYLGQIAFARGQQAEARKWWIKCLEWEPNNIEATRGLRMVNSREEKAGQSKSGLLGKFLSKKP